jgi:hypothetical protein
MTSLATQTRQVKPGKKVTRSAKVQRLGDSLILWLTVGKNVTAYRMTPLASDFGRAVRLQKADRGEGSPETYDVCVNGRQTTCECLGFLHHGHCKHADGLKAVIASGQLADALPEPTEPEGEEETADGTEAPAEPERVCFECGQPSRDFYCDQCGNL